MPKKPNNYYGLAFDKDLLKDKRQKEWKKQRATRGFDDTELWSLDATLLDWLYPRLEQLAKHRKKHFWFEPGTTDPVMDLYKFLKKYYNKKTKNMICDENFDYAKFDKLFSKAFHCMWY